VAALRKAGGSPKYTEYPGVDHGSWGPALQEPGLPAWLFAQVRSPAVSITPVPGGLRQRRGDAPGRPRLLLAGRELRFADDGVDGAGRIRR
jgi:hypothetical protein